MRTFPRAVPATALLGLSLLAAACAGEAPATAEASASAGASAPEVDLQAERVALEQASAAVVAAESAEDLEGALAWWTPDAILHVAGAPAVQGTQGLREMYGTFFGMIDSFEGETTALHLAASGDLAWEHGVNRMVYTGSDGQVVEGKYLAVWRKMPDGWRVAAVAVTDDVPMPAGVGG